jgi:hypothetical protein
MREGVIAQKSDVNGGLKAILARGVFIRNFTQKRSTPVYNTGRKHFSVISDDSFSVARPGRSGSVIDV